MSKIEPPKLNVRVISSLEKVFADEELQAAEYTHATALLDERYSFQVAVKLDGLALQNLQISIESDLPVRVDEVALVRSELPVNPRYTGPVLRTVPGLYPDLLRPMRADSPYNLIGGQWRAFWVEADLTCEDIMPGVHEITVVFSHDMFGELARVTFSLDVINARLPAQKLINTNWFHGDCIADYYKLPVFSEKHWAWMEDQLTVACRYGQTMVLTPLFTPPLDTKVGGERTTIQLVDVFVDDKGAYTFGFGKLLRFVEMARRAGIEYFEMSHLFTQWGALHAPKIIARMCNGSEKRIFGWETEAAGEEYTAFLEAFIPELKKFLEANGMENCTYFHVSDEPSGDQLEQYRLVGDKFRALVAPYPVMDALSDFAFYENGAVEHPIPANDHIEPFLAANVPNLWTYYCVSQCRDVSNRFFGFGSERNRVIGVQLFKYDIVGFLQWGFNFYNSQYSLRHIDPFEVTDAGRAFPSGDPFMVYPGEHETMRSVRQLVFNEGLQDQRAFSLAAEIYGKDKIVAAIEEGIDPITFTKYPCDKAWLLGVRAKINEMIRAKI